MRSGGLTAIVEGLRPWLRHLHLCKAALAVLRPFAGRKASTMSMAEAEGVLRTIHTGSDDSCVHEGSWMPAERELEVIVAAYNEERHLARCLDSILGQDTGYDFAVTVVDDGSTDGTAEVLRRYDGRIRVIRQENGGLSAARNAALETARAEYLLFVDADDMLTPGTVEALMRRAEATDADVVECAYDRVDAEGKAVSHHEAPTGMVWGKAIRAELFSRVRFPVGYWHEDGIWSTLIVPLVRRMETLRHTGYLYSINPQGITSHERGERRMLDIYWMCKTENDDRLRLGIADTQRLYDECLDDVIRVVRTTWMLPECEAYISAMGHQMRSERFARFRASTWRLRQIEKPLLRGQTAQVMLAAVLL